MIVKNDYLELRNVDGESRLFGKCGFQTMSSKTDKITMANMAAIERAYDAGKLTDINGNPVDPKSGDAAVIVSFSRITKVRGAAELDQVGTLQGIGGTTSNVPAPEVADSDADNPLA